MTAFCRGDVNMPAYVVVWLVPFEAGVLLLSLEICQPLVDDWEGVLGGVSPVTGIWDGYQRSDNWFEEARCQTQIDGSARDDVHGKFAHVLQKVLVPTDWQSKHHSVRNTRYDSHHVLPDPNLFPSLCIQAPCLIHRHLYFLPHIRYQWSDSAWQVFMDHVFMVWIFENLRGGESIVSFEAVVVESRRAEDIVWLFNKPGHLSAWQDDFRFAGDVGQEVGYVLLAILQGFLSS